MQADCFMKAKQGCGGRVERGKDDGDRERERERERDVLSELNKTLYTYNSAIAIYWYSFHIRILCSLIKCNSESYVDLIFHIIGEGSIQFVMRNRGEDHGIQLIYANVHKSRRLVCRQFYGTSYCQNFVSSKYRYI